MDTGWWVGNLINSGQTPLLAAWVFWVIASICLHELSHGWAAIWQGDPTPRISGHMTINPLVHMGMWSLIAFALTGLAWGAMPVDPSRFRWGRRGDIVVAAAGPAMNLLIAVVTIVALGVVSGTLVPQEGPSPTQLRLLQFLHAGAYLNLLLFIFNLLPVPPLDGSRIVGGLNRRAYEFYAQPMVQTIGFMLLIFLLGGVIGGPLASWASKTTASGADAVASLFG